MTGSKRVISGMKGSKRLILVKKGHFGSNRVISGTLGSKGYFWSRRVIFGQKKRPFLVKYGHFWSKRPFWVKNGHFRPFQVIFCQFAGQKTCDNLVGPKNKAFQQFQV